MCFRDETSGRIGQRGVVVQVSSLFEQVGREGERAVIEEVWCVSQSIVNGAGTRLDGDNYMSRTQAQGEEV